MKSAFFEDTLHSLRNQRNFAAVLICLLSLCLVLSCSYLFFKKERIVIVPAIVEKEFWVDSTHISPTYLEQFGCFLGQLLLTKSSYTAEAQKKVLLRHVDPLYSAALLERLEKEQQILAKGNSSYAFFISGIEVSPETNSVLLKGNRIFSVAGKTLSEEKESYLLSFSYKDARLLINRLENIANPR
jgi:conjugal transfer pilus assembly protein TraE